MHFQTLWAQTTRCLAAASIAVIALASPAGAEPITIAHDGSMADGPSAESRITPDGRYITYHSAATNLTPLNTRGGINVYVHDRVLGINSIVSISQLTGDSILGDAPSIRPDISDDGRYVVFESAATNLVAGDTDGFADIFLYDRFTGSLERLTAGVQGDSERPRISGNGDFVVFQTKARLLDADTNSVSDIYRKDWRTGEFMLVSQGQHARPANGASTYAAINRDGSMIAFQSKASNLVPGDGNDAQDVFVYDATRRMTKTVSSTDPAMRFDGADGVNVSFTGNGASMQPAISGDGRWVAFASDASDIAPDDRNGTRDIFVCDGVSGSIELITRDYFGVQANGFSERPDISDDGTFVGFESDATNLVMFDDNGIRDAFSVERSNGQVARLSAEASEEMENATGFGMVAVVGINPGGGPDVFNELPTDFGDIGPGDDDDGMIIPGNCRKIPFCEARDANNIPVEFISVDPGEEVFYTLIARTLCLGRVLTVDVGMESMLPPGAIHTPALPRVGVPNGRVTSDFNWTPTVDDLGVHEILYRVVDNQGRIGACVITITVGACESEPLCDIDYDGPTTIAAGTPISFTLSGQSFCNGRTIDIEALEIPTGAMTTPMLPTSGVGDTPTLVDVQWTPAISDVGTMQTFRFRTSDAFDQASECSVTFEVIAPTCDSLPTCDITGPMVINAAPGDLITFDVTGSTLCPDLTLTLDAMGVPSRATLNPTIPVVGAMGADVATSFAWTPTAEDFGETIINFTVTDDLDRSSQCSVTINVGACDDAPTCELPDGDNFIVFMNEMVTFSILGDSDCPGAVLTLDSDSLPAGAMILEGLPVVGAPGQPVLGTFQWAPAVDGLFVVDFTVTDQTGESSECSVTISVVDCDLLPVLTVDPDEPFLVAPGDFVTFTADGTTECPKTGLLMTFTNVPDGAAIIPNPVLESGPDQDVGAIFEWIPSDADIGQDFLVDITLTDTFGRSVRDTVEIVVTVVCAEVEDNNTPEMANIIDADCVYISGKLQKNPVVVCEPDTFLTLFDKNNNVINRDDNGSSVGNGWASGLTDLGIRNNGAPSPIGDGGDGLINNNDGSYSLRMGITGRPDGLDGVFNGLFLNAAHGQLGAFRVTVTFKNINGNVIVPIGFPSSAPLENPVTYEGEFVTGAEAFYINYTAPLGTAMVDIEIDNQVENDFVCNDIDFFTIRGLIPLCDYCITQVGGIDCECRPTDLNLGWFDKLGNLIDKDDNSGPVEGYAELCIVADANGHATIGVTGTGDDNFDGLADAWEDASARAPVECNEPPHGHGVCGCYTLCIMVTGPHGGTSQAATLDSTIAEDRMRGDLNGDGTIDSADLAQLLGLMQNN